VKEPGSIRFSSEMGITHAEFFRLIPAAIAGHSYTLQPNEVLITDGDRCISITLSPERRRMIGRLSLPVTRVDFTFSGYAKPEADTFMAQFKLHFQRGGG
jgi:hypothetical protein